MVDNAPFFIIGAGRSGTTLLRLILTGHSRLQIPPETWFLEELVTRFPVVGSLSKEQLRAVADTITTHRRWVDMQIPSERFQESVQNLENPTLRDVTTLIYEHHL